jgi:cytochrome c oxidase subunit III
MTAIALTRDDVERREEVTRLGLWMFLATVTMLFAAFSSAYIVRSSGSDWRRMSLPNVLWLNTVLLVASSVAVEIAARAGSRQRWTAAGAWFAAAVALGLGFVGGQWNAWRELAAAGVYLPSGPYSAFFYMMTGAHALHVLAALIVLCWGAAKTWRGDGRRDLRSWRASIGLCRTFWHYLLGVWVYLFAFLLVY